MTSVRSSAQIRNQLRAVLVLAFPELNERFRGIDGKSALAFLAKKPDALVSDGFSRSLTREEPLP